jgi:hypothetical protein
MYISWKIPAKEISLKVKICPIIEDHDISPVENYQEKYNQLIN